MYGFTSSVSQSSENVDDQEKESSKQLRKNAKDWFTDRRAPPRNYMDCKDLRCDARMYHMKKASIRDLRYGFRKIERLLHKGEEIQITKRRRVIARLVPERAPGVARLPDFLARLRSIYGEKLLRVRGAELVAEDRNRY